MMDDTKKLLERLEDLRNPFLAVTIDEFEAAARRMIVEALPPDVTSHDPAHSGDADLLHALASSDMLAHLIEWLDQDSPVFQRIISDAGLRARHGRTEEWLDEVAELGWSRAGGAA